ncbi:hypothetical protein [Emticicia agri]|uniref:DUF3575 domain-containing protein n=1 Tax=Emticicia agri TaxID=2492393 RepID=A0A4Q5LTW1_9BACT|nr:hypothetical protein [Emticicia agri]RYU93096.1 hypothetical protein EWM59_23710 [Emticicia agri]
MKKLRFLLFCISISLFSTQAFAQLPQDYTAIIKTNVLIFKDIQQWALLIETNTKKPKQTNNYTIGYNQLSDDRTGYYASYARRFYFPFLFEQLYFFGSPYGKVIYRDVNSDGFWYFGGPRFQSASISAGGNLGIQAIQFKRMSIEFLTGIGLGVVCWKQKYSGDALPVHLDGQLMINLGYMF